MIALIKSLLGFGGATGVAAQNGSAYGPSDCPLCSGRRAVAPGTDLSQRERHTTANANHTEGKWNDGDGTGTVKL